MIIEQLQCSCEVAAGYCFQLECGCNICAICFLGAQACRGCNPFLSCPACIDSADKSPVKSTSTTWKIFQLFEKEKISKRRTEQTNQCSFRAIEIHKGESAVQTHKIQQPSLYDNPKQYHCRLIWNKTQHDFETIIVSLTATDKQKELITFAAKLDSNEVWHDETNNHLISIFQLLHKPLVKFDEGVDDLSALLDPNIPLDMMSKDCSLLHRCLHTLATQERIYQKPNDSTAYRRLRASLFAAADIIRFTKGSAAGRFQEFITRHLVAYGANQGPWKVLNQFNLSKSLDANCRKAIKDVNNGLKID